MPVQLLVNATIEALEGLWLDGSVAHTGNVLVMSSDDKSDGSWLRLMARGLRTLQLPMNIKGLFGLWLNVPHFA